MSRIRRTHFLFKIRTMTFQVPAGLVLDPVSPVSNLSLGSLPVESPPDLTCTKTGWRVWTFSLPKPSFHYAFEASSRLRFSQPCFMLQACILLPLPKSNILIARPHSFYFLPVSLEADCWLLPGRVLISLEPCLERR